MDKDIEATTLRYTIEKPQTYKRRRRTQQFKKVYKNSRKCFRTVAFGLWASAAVFALIKSYDSQHQINFSDSVHSRSIRDVSKAGGSETENPVDNTNSNNNSNDSNNHENTDDKTLTKEEKYCPDYTKGTEDMFNCMYDKAWLPYCWNQADVPKNAPMDQTAFSAAHRNDYSLSGLKQDKWRNNTAAQANSKLANEKTGYQPADYRITALCCIGEERKHHMHNGPIDEFPKTNIFTHEEIKDGFFIIHLLVSLYMFAALAIVCDDYFVPALERLSEELKLSEDVAGATFMAAGSSAPELFTSVIGVFVAKSDIGVGTIVGSAVFNILVIIGACGLFVKGDIPLSWWPLFRDSMFYLLTIVTLLIVIYPSFDDMKCPTLKDETQSWFVSDAGKANGKDDAFCASSYGPLINNPAEFKENCYCKGFESLATYDLLLGENQKFGKSEVSLVESIAMLIMYSLYIVIMKFNRPLEKFFAKLFGYEVSEDEEGGDDAGQKQSGGQQVSQNIQLSTLKEEQNAQATPMMARRGDNNEAATGQQTQSNVATADVAAALKQNTPGQACNSDFDDAGLRVMMTSGFAPRTRLRMAAKLVAKNQENFVVAKQTDSATGNTKTVLLQKKTGDETPNVPKMIEQNCNANNNVEMENMRLQQSYYNKNNNNNNDDEEDDDEEGPSNPWELPDSGIVDTLKFLIAWPISLTLWYTVPQCGKEEYKHLYMLAFLISTAWIAAYSYVMVWMVAYVGFALNINDTIMGLTFLAAGTSVPDTIASILVAQQGLGDMAVSNSIGSNVFDILLGLALPWSLSMIVATFMPDPPCFKLAQFTKKIVINSKGLVVSVALLLFSLIFVVSVIKFSGWKLNTRAGILIGFAYIGFLVGAIYNESQAVTH